MKKTYYIFLIICIICVACNSNKIEYLQPRNLDITKAVVEADHLEFYSLLNCWLEPAENPYEVKIIRSSTNHSIQATHYAVKFCPESEASLNSLLQDTTIQWSTIPFGYRQVPEDRIPPSECVSSTLLSESNDSNYSNCSLAGVREDKTIIPIFAHWPVDRALPTNVPYEIQYELYFSGNNRDFEIDGRDTTVLIGPKSIEIKTFDGILNEYVPIRGANVTLLSFIPSYETTLTTDYYGRVIIPEDAPLSSYISLKLESSDFMICNEATTVAISQSLGQLISFDLNSTGSIYSKSLPYDFKRQVYLSAWYYYNGFNPLLDWENQADYGQVFKIHVYPNVSSIQHPYNGGVTTGIGWYIQDTYPYIEICNFSSSPSRIFGVTLHELGHATHHYHLSSTYNQVNPVVKESFADFHGWYNVKKYYSSVFNTDALVHNNCSNGNQTWNASSNSNYTPFFIDLVDSYNQYFNIGVNYVNDNISNLPVNKVFNLAVGPLGMSSVKSLLYNEIGNYFTLSDYNNFVQMY